MATFRSKPIVKHSIRFGTVLQHRIGSHSGTFSCSCRLMAMTHEQGVLLSWDTDPKAVGKPTYFFPSEWEPIDG